MSSDVQIKQFELSDKEALLSFLSVAYVNEPRKADPVYWNWHCLQNPYAASGNIPLWVVKKGDEIVGQAGTIPVRLQVGDDERIAIWILEFILLPEYRGQGLGKRLLLLARATHPTMFALGYNEMSGNVLRRLEWVTMGNIHRYQRLLFPGVTIKETVPPLRELINLCYTPMRPRAGRLTSSREMTVRAVTKFDESFDDLWLRASKQWPCAVVREAKYLDWQFMKQPGKKFEVLGLYDGEKLHGYAVLFFRKAERGGFPPKAAISDLCYDAERANDVIDELLKASLRLAIERRAGSLVMDVLDLRVENHLRRFGFWQIKRSPPFMVYSPDRRELMYDARNWFLTRADSDVSIFEEPNI